MWGPREIQIEFIFSRPLHTSITNFYHIFPILLASKLDASIQNIANMKFPIITDISFTSRVDLIRTCLFCCVWAALGECERSEARVRSSNMSAQRETQLPEGGVSSSTAPNSCKNGSINFIQVVTSSPSKHRTEPDPFPDRSGDLERCQWQQSRQSIFRRI